MAQAYKGRPADGTHLITGRSIAEENYLIDYRTCFWTKEQDYMVGETYWADEAFQRTQGGQIGQSQYDKI